MCKCGECGKYLSHSHWTILIEPLPSSKSEIVWFHPNSSWLDNILGKGQTMLSTEGVLDKAVHCGIWFYCNHPTWVGACLLPPSYGFNCTSNTIVKVTARYFERYEIRLMWRHTENVKGLWWSSLGFRRYGSVKMRDNWGTVQNTISIFRSVQCNTEGKYFSLRL